MGKERDISWRTLEAQMHALADTMPLMLFTFDRDGVVTHSEGKGFARLGRPPEASIGLSVFELYAKVPWILDAVTRALAGENVRTVGQLAGGWYDGQLVPLRDDSGEIVAVTGLALDITEQRHDAEHRLADQARMRVLVEQIPAIVWTTDLELRVTSVEGAGLKRFDEDASQNIGRSVEEMLRSYKNDMVALDLQKRALLGERLTRDIVYRGADYVMRVEPLSDPDGAIVGVIGMIFDISERRAAERERDRLLQEAKDAIRVRDDFLAVASHKLNTPLMSLLLGVEKLRKTSPGKLIDIVHRQTGRLVHLVHSLLDVSRLSAGRLELHLEPVDLGTLAQDVVDRHSLDAQKASCKISVRVIEPVIGQWDRSRIEQILTNLLTNALKFGAGKPIEIHIAKNKDNERALLIVSDQGIGVGQDDKGVIFDRFQRAVPVSAYGGLGLGLYITLRLVEAHGGIVSIDSEVGQGASFRVELPLSRADA